MVRVDAPGPAKIRCVHSPLVYWPVQGYSKALGSTTTLGSAIMKKYLMLGIIVGTAVIATPVSFNWPSEHHAVVTLNSADAKVGKPLSAGSVAGVHRRQGRREQHKSN
jgi:hypothetical protein